MSHCYYSISFQLFFIFSLLVITLARDTPQTQTHAITSCLTLGNVNNFTAFPNITYYQLLNFSIQNLRFLEPNVPKPTLIILPESADQLARTILCCREASWEFRVRCGGHSYEGTSSVSTDGAPFAIIDMMNLNRVRIDPESETAWVEGGATLGETYYAISLWSDVHGFSAGSCPTVGVGGHISGGGFGLLSRKYGLAADNVVDAILVDAEGRVLDRRAMGEDVFWALRGGGGGVWGIVFAWKIRLLRVPKTVTSFVASRSQHVAKLVDKWQHVAPRLPPEFYLSVFVGSGLPGLNPDAGVSATFKGFYLGSETETMTIINKSFPELEIVAEKESREMSWVESVLFFSGLSGTSSVSNLKDRYLPPQDRNYFKAKADYVQNPISIGGIRVAMKILEKEPKGYVILDPYGGIMDDISSVAIAFPHRRGNLFTIQYLVEWKQEDHHNNKSDEYFDWIRGFYDSMSPFVSSSPRAAYINYMDLDLGAVLMEEDHDNGDYLIQNHLSLDDPVEIARLWGEKYFLKNYDRLVKAKTIIDPNNIFNNQQGIPPFSSTNLRGKTH